MMAEDRPQDGYASGAASRRRVLAAAAMVPLLAGAAPAAARTLPAGENGPAEPTGAAEPAHSDEPAHAAGAADPAGTAGHLIRPAATSESDWADVADALGRGGNMLRESTYHTGFPRRDLHVVSDGVVVTPGLSLGTHVAFVRYADGSTMLMGDVVVTEDELQQVSDAWHEHGIEQTALHKHLLSQYPAIWWTHVHAHGHDAAAMARGLRAGLDRTATPPPKPPPPEVPLDLDTAGIEAALGVRGSTEESVFKCLFVRRETIADGHLVLPPGLGSTSAFIFQPTGGGRAALNGDCAMTAQEVQHVLKALRSGGIELVELHHHHLTESPRLFFVHFWAVGDAVELARTLRRAVDATDVVPLG
ncbi:DUF1259 domain-containing protein [Streptomyces jumonjinensis]|uniref:DUF1259 domain-containing protein n=1 Tax=Streptomyces jumonjinensis TaxID=1945 RepID=A0A646KJP3_STRJU|nr:DUF1259 domain-containing protein [Streptomyces jumonjinensis]MQT02290.1 DUF1259 domain-containing protein [Streptomyces jumonjinensis]